MKLSITYNKEKDGIELRFDPKPDKRLTSLLKAKGFQYSLNQKMWHIAHHTQADAFAHALKEILESDGDINTFEVIPRYEPSDENIDHNNFSYVTIALKEPGGKTAFESYVVFDPSKALAEYVAERFSEITYGEQFKRVNVHARKYKRKARKLLQEGRVIEKNSLKGKSSTQSTPKTHPNKRETTLKESSFEHSTEAIPQSSNQILETPKTDPFVNKHGIYTEELAKERLEKIEIPFPKSYKTTCAIRLVKGSDDQFRYGVNIQTGNWGHSFAPSVKGKAFKQRSDVLKAALQFILSTKELDERAKNVIHKFAQEQNIDLEANTSSNASKVTEEVIRELEAIAIEAANTKTGDVVGIMENTSGELKQALSIKDGEKFLEAVKKAVEPYLSWESMIEDNQQIRHYEVNEEDRKLRKKAVNSINKLLELINLSPIEIASSPPSEVDELLSIANEVTSQHNLNKQIEKFIGEKDKKQENYSDQDKAFIARYAGSGGQIKKGATGKGVLYEYYTSDEIVKKMWGLAYIYGYKSGDILEPSVGTGNFLKYAPKNANITAYETNPISARITEILYPHAKVIRKPFESVFFTGNVHLKDDFGDPTYSLVIGNPPYGEFSGRYAGMGEKRWTSASEYDQYFITRGLDLLIKDGLLIFIIPSAFLANESKYNKVKEKIAKKAKLVDAYRLPSGVFKTTDIGTDILVFKRF